MPDLRAQPADEGHATSRRLVFLVGLALLFMTAGAAHVFWPRSAHLRTFNQGGMHEADLLVVERGLVESFALLRAGVGLQPSPTPPGPGSSAPGR